MKVIEFRRVSTQEQGNDDRAGLPRQEEANRLTAIRFDLNIMKVFELTDVSGASVLETPEWAELVSLLNSRAFAGVVVSDLDRLGRPIRFESYKYLDAFADTGTKIFLPSGPLDPATQSGNLMGVIHSAIAGNELTQIMKRVSEGKEIKRKMGRHPNSNLTLPYGVAYDRASEKFYYKEPEIHRIKELFRHFYEAGIQNMRELARLSNFHHRTVANLLRNEIYIGFRTYEYKRSNERRTGLNGRQADKRKIRRAPDEIIRCKVIDEPLIDESVFWKVQEILSTKNKEYHTKRSIPGKSFLYSGFLKCGICGKKIYTNSGGRNHKKDYYVCCSKKLLKYHPGDTKCSSGYMPKAVLENSITSFVTEKVSDKEFLIQSIEMALSERKHRNEIAEINRLEKQIMNLRKKRERCLDLYLDSKFELNEINEVVQKIADEIKEVEVRLLNKKNNLDMVLNTDIEKIAVIITSTLNEFPFWSAPQKRNFLRAQIPEFSVTEKGVTGFSLNFSNLDRHTGTGS